MATIDAVKSIIILISGQGSNLQAVAESARRNDWAKRFDASVAAVISNRPDAPGLVWARQTGLASEVVDHTRFASREAFDEALAETIDRQDSKGCPALVVLAGFMRILTPGFVRHYEGRLVNIHPSLLPAFTGLNTHQRAIDAGRKTAGATVHWVTAQLDDGGRLAQATVPILAGDTAATLAARVRLQEHVIYPAAIERVLKERQIINMDVNNTFF